MRIIAGKARGTKLYTLEGLETRPTLDRVKESVFNIIQNEIKDSIFLDLFSGSGAIGLEAASRGAKKAILCEKSSKAVEIIKKNIEKTHLEKETVLYEEDYETFISTKLQENPDIIYLDPPYKTEYAINAIKILKEREKIKTTTIIIIETDKEKELMLKIKEIKSLEIYKIKKYGRASLIFLKDSLN